MLIGLDHIIIGVNNLEQATQTFNEKLGLAVSGGGKHPEGGTENRIIVIGDTYIELIAVRAPLEAQPSMVERLAKGAGYLNFVLGSNDIQADSVGIKQRGISIIGPRQGQLSSGNGRTRGWMRTDIERPDLTQHYPFLIQHDSAGEERRSQLAGWKTPPEHPLGAVRVLGTTLAVEDLVEATERFQRIYGIQASTQFSGEAEGWDALLVAFLLPGSQQRFELATPLRTVLASSDEGKYIPEPGALGEYLQRFGESLCRVTLAVESLQGTREYLDAHAVKYLLCEGMVWILPDDACGAVLVLKEEKGIKEF